MDNVLVPLKDDASPASVLKTNRLLQILMVADMAVIVGLVFTLAIGWRWGIAQKALVFSSILYSLCMWLVLVKKERYAVTLFLLSVTFMSCTLIYTSDGLHDEAVAIFPGLLLFACMFGSRTQFFGLLLGIICFVIYVFVGHYYGWHIIPDRSETNFSSMTNVIVIVASTGFFSYVLGNDLRKALSELRQSKNDLLELNDQLELRVKQRTEQYEGAIKDLKASLEKLEHVRSELMQSEKLASLGSMVAGISHELNTPIGNALLSSSSLKQRFEVLIGELQVGSLKKVKFDDFVEVGNEMSDLIFRSTKRAAELVSSFKQVAIDQTSEQRRDFDLRDVIEDNVATFLPSIKKRPIHVENLIPPGIRFNSFPGPLGQVVTNLLQNAALHGFTENRGGTIRIDVEETAHTAVVKVSDNGIGMSQQVMAHVFDPFFTTKLGQGGSGLGLTISHRLVTNVLGGTIVVNSGQDGGALFVVSVPKIAPFPL